MADANSIRFFHGDLFTFLVGPKSVPIKVHVALLKEKSAPLHALASNGMKETQDGIARLPEEDPITFSFFVEWAYTSLYRVQECGNSSQDQDTAPKDVLPEALRCELAEAACRECNSFRVTYVSASIKHDCRTCGKLTTARCNDCDDVVKGTPVYTWKCGSCEKERSEAFGLIENGIRHRFTMFRALEFPVGEYGKGRFSEMFAAVRPAVPISRDILVHVRMFIFAEKYLVDALGQLSIHMLHQSLLLYSVESRGSTDLVTALKKAYKNTSQPEEHGKMNNLCYILMEFAACQSEPLLRHKHFREMMTEGGIIPLHFADCMSKGYYF